jgi:hypothetical protein
MIDWGVIVDKVPSVGLVLVFVWFTLKMLREFRQQSEKRDDSYLGKLSELGNSHSDGMETVSKDIQVVSKDIQAQTSVMVDMCRQMDTNDDLLEFIAEDVKTRQIRGD